MAFLILDMAKVGLNLSKFLQKRKKVSSGPGDPQRSRIYRQNTQAGYSRRITNRGNDPYLIDIVKELLAEQGKSLEILRSVLVKNHTRIM